MIPIPIYIFILIELSLVAYMDIKYRKIKNSWSILNVLIAVSLFFIFPRLYPFGWDAFQFTFVFIAVGFFLFLLKIMGGGDSKFLATIFLIIPVNNQDAVFYYLLLITIIVGMIMFVKNVFINRDKLISSIKNKSVGGIKSCFGTKFAYAPVILITWLWIGWMQFIN